MDLILPRTHRVAVILGIASVAPGCATWAYGVKYEPVVMTADPGEIEVVYVPGTGRLGQLSVRNDSAAEVYLVWDDLVTTKDSQQQKAYKGSVRKMNAEMSVPKQTVSSGATVSETVVTDAHYGTTAQRPATWADWTLGIFYGLGVWIGNMTWEPGPDDVATALPGWETQAFTLIVPLEVNGEVQRLKLTTTAAEVVTAKVTPTAE